MVGLSRSPAVQRKFDFVEAYRRMRNSAFWGAVNAGVLLLILYDLTYRCTIYSALWHNLQLLLLIVLSVNTSINLYRYVSGSRLVFCEEVTLAKTPTTVVKPDVKPQSHHCKEEFSLYRPSHKEFTVDELISPPQVDFNTLLNSSSSLLNMSSPIKSQKELNDYLTQFAEVEKSMVADVSQSWASPSNFSVSPVLRRLVYQSAPMTVDSGDPRTSLIEEGGSPTSQKHQELWSHFRINPNNLVNWVSNLRMWIAETILHRIVDEMTNVDTGMRSQGLAGFTIGSIGLDALTQTAHNPIVSQQVPTLANLVHFLEVSPYQNYVVGRIRELGLGSSMAEFRWKSGGRYEDKDWEPYLPTDAQLVMHLVATYLDSQLPLLPTAPEARPFSSQYFVKLGAKPGNQPLAIVHASASPPQYKLLVNGTVHDVPLGRNNLFYVLILFLHVVYTDHLGMLGRMNLGPSGVNMLWIIEGANPKRWSP